MFGDSPFRRTGHHDDPPSRWRARRGPLVPADHEEQEQEVRAKLYAKPPATERTVEVLGPVQRIADRPAA